MVTLVEGLNAVFGVASDDVHGLKRSRLKASRGPSRAGVFFARLHQSGRPAEVRADQVMARWRAV